MKRFGITALLWLVISFSVSKIITAFVEQIELQIYLFIVDVFISTIVSIQISKFFFPNKSYSINTRLGPSGTISGPNFNLPTKFSVKYESALHIPVVNHYYDALDNYEGFIIDFGNGKTGIMYGKMTITGSKSGLKLSVKSSGGSLSIT